MPTDRVARLPTMWHVPEVRRAWESLETFANSTHDDRKPRRWLLIAVRDHKLAELPLSQTTDDSTIGNPDEEPAAERNDETAHCDRQ